MRLHTASYWQYYNTVAIEALTYLSMTAIVHSKYITHNPLAFTVAWQLSKMLGSITSFLGSCMENGIGYMHRLVKPPRLLNDSIRSAATVNLCCKLTLAAL